MPVSERAKQFAPFAALRGFDAALREKEKIVVEKISVSEDAAEELDRKLRALRNGSLVTATYYCSGEYLRRTGMVTRIDLITRTLKIVDTAIPFDDLLELSAEGERDVYDQ